MLRRASFLFLKHGFSRGQIVALTGTSELSSYPLRNLCIRPAALSRQKEEIQQKIEAYEEDKPISVRHRLKVLARDYGATVMVVHISISLCSLGACYLMVSAGLPLSEWISQLGFGSEEKSSSLVAGGTFTIAYLIHKCLMPLRIGATGILTPILVNTLRKKGILKPMTDAAAKAKAKKG